MKTRADNSPSAQKAPGHPGAFLCLHEYRRSRRTGAHSGGTLVRKASPHRPIAHFSARLPTGGSDVQEGNHQGQTQGRRDIRAMVLGEHHHAQGTGDEDDHHPSQVGSGVELPVSASIMIASVILCKSVLVADMLPFPR